MAAETLDVVSELRNTLSFAEIECPGWGFETTSTIREERAAGFAARFRQALFQRTRSRRRMQAAQRAGAAGTRIPLQPARQRLR